MGKVLGVALIVVGIVLGVYLDIWVLLVGGITEIVNGFTAQPVNGGQVAWGFVRAFVLAGAGVFVTFWLLIVPGVALVAGSRPRFALRRRRTR